jgi:carbonic anhydrase/acetyltransferase-like protein (isoleucine patch superfamily)
MRDLIILGTGVHAAEMVEIVARVNDAEPRWNLLGLVASEDRPAVAGEERSGCPVFGMRAALDRSPHAWFVPDNEWPRPTGVPRDRLATLVDPSSFLSRTAHLGAGCVIYPNCFIGLNAVLGDRVFVLSGSTLNHDVQLADDVVVCSGVSLAGGVCVEQGCYLGQNCTVRQGLRIGRGSLVGMGSVVVKDVPPATVVVGSPARKLRDASVGMA